MSTTEEIVSQMRKEFDSLLEYVISGSEGDLREDRRAEPRSAYDLECGVFRRVMDLGRTGMEVFLYREAERHRCSSTSDGAGEPLAYHSERKRSLVTIFGKVRFTRSYYYEAGRGGRCPMDAALNLPRKGVSDLLRECQELLSVSTAYHSVGTILGKLFGRTVSSREMQSEVLEEAKEVAAYYAQSEPVTPDLCATILVMQADGKGVPLIKEAKEEAKERLGKGEKTGKKKEAIVTAVYTVAPMKRTPMEFLLGLFPSFRGPFGAPGRALGPGERAPDQDGSGLSLEPRSTQGRPKPQNKWLWATLDGKEAAVEFAAHEVARQEGPSIQHRIALTDGSEPLQQRVRSRLSGFTLILDFIHVDEYLWKAANGLLGEKAPERTQWVAARSLTLLRGDTHAVIAEFRQLASTSDGSPTQAGSLLTAAAYFERNLPFMHYDQYLAEGFPICTGVIEGACRHLVKDRCELSGMQWTKDGAEAILHLRSVAENGDWEAFHAFRRDRRRTVLYSLPSLLPSSPNRLPSDPRISGSDPSCSKSSLSCFFAPPHSGPSASALLC